MSNQHVASRLPVAQQYARRRFNRISGKIAPCNCVAFLIRLTQVGKTDQTIIFCEATMATGKKAASDAAKILRNPKSNKKEKEVAASDLSGRKGATKTKPKTR